MDGGFSSSVGWFPYHEQGMEDAEGSLDDCEFLFSISDALHLDNSCQHNHPVIQHQQGQQQQHPLVSPQSPSNRDAYSYTQPLYDIRTTGTGWKQPLSATTLPPPPFEDRSVPPTAEPSMPETPGPHILSFEAHRQATSEEAKQRSGDGRGLDGGEFLISRVPSTAAPQRGNQGGGGRPPAIQQEHTIAERKRREKLSQRFIALSAMVPGLSKMDKASILAGAARYMKELQERVQCLEKQAARQTVVSVVVKKSMDPDDTDTSCFSDGDNSDGGGTSLTTETSTEGGINSKTNSLPVVEAKVTDRAVLLRIQCERRKGVLVRTLAEVERLGLSVLSSSVMPFAGSVLDLTVAAQMEDGFDVTAKDLVRRLKVGITQIS